MKNFCIYNGKKIVKPDIWNITSIELLGDYTSVIIQAESEANTSQHTLDITPLISNQYKNDIDPYSVTIVNELTGVSDWILNSYNNQIKYYEEPSGNSGYQYGYKNNESNTTVFTESQARLGAQAFFDRVDPNNRTVGNCTFNSNNTAIECEWWWKPNPNDKRSISFPQVANPAYDPDAEREEKYLPLTTVVSQVISNAANGDVNAQQVILSTVFSPSIIRSLSDSDMQQWQAVKDAVGELTGATEWTFDNVNKVVGYVGTTTGIQPSDQYIYQLPNIDGKNSADSVCIDYLVSANATSTFEHAYATISDNYFTCFIRRKSNSEIIENITGDVRPNPNYDPNYAAPTVSITYQQVADKIITNSNVADQGVSLLAETYIQESLLKFTDVDLLIPKFEASKQPKQEGE